MVVFSGCVASFSLLLAKMMSDFQVVEIWGGGTAGDCRGSRLSGCVLVLSLRQQVCLKGWGLWGTRTSSHRRGESQLREMRQRISQACIHQGTLITPNLEQTKTGKCCSESKNITILEFGWLSCGSGFISSSNAFVTIYAIVQVSANPRSSVLEILRTPRVPPFKSRPVNRMKLVVARV